MTHPLGLLALLVVCVARALFNESTGFRVIETAMGEPAMIVPKLDHAVTRGLADQPANIASAVQAFPRRHLIGRWTCR